MGVEKCIYVSADPHQRSRFFVVSVRCMCLCWRLRGGLFVIRQDLVDRIFIEQIKELEVAEDIMTAPVKTCRPVETMEEVAA